VLSCEITAMNIHFLCLRFYLIVFSAGFGWLATLERMSGSSCTFLRHSIHSSQRCLRYDLMTLHSGYKYWLGFSNRLSQSPISVRNKIPGIKVFSNITLLNSVDRRVTESCKHHGTKRSSTNFHSIGILSTCLAALLYHIHLNYLD
jgi:hypothetical protein